MKAPCTQYVTRRPMNNLMSQFDEESRTEQVSEFNGLNTTGVEDISQAQTSHYGTTGPTVKKPKTTEEFWGDMF